MGPQSTVSYEGTEGEMYNVIDDRYQFVNLWDDPGYRQRRNELVEELRASLPPPAACVPVSSFA
jgi:hypothetical protein